MFDRNKISHSVRLRARAGRQRGSVAVAAIVALAVGLTVSVGMLLAGEGARAAGHHEARTRAARAMAEAGVEYGYWQYAYKGASLPFSQARALGGGSFAVTISGNGTAIQRSVKIVSVGTVGADSATVTRVLLDPFYKVKITGTVFEDINYGGGAGRSLSGASGVRLPNVRVELYDASGTFSSAVLTDSNGLYAFSGVVNGASGFVRVVGGTALSSRVGATGALLPVQTFRVNASSGGAIAVLDHVGGENPALADAGSGSTTLAALSSPTTVAQSVAPVTVGANDLSQVDFGFNFDTVVNKNDSGQGSLRQFLLNANALSNVGLAQAGLTPSLDNAVFMLADGTARPGLNVGYATQFSASVASIAPLSALPTVSDPAVLDATRQPGWVSLPIVELSGAGAGAGPHQVGRTFTESDKARAGALADVAAVVVNVRLYENERADFLRSLEALARTLDDRNPYTQGHSERVAQVCIRLAQKLGVAPEIVQDLYDGALLHDIGKIGIPEAVLDKPGQLSAEEFALIKQIPLRGGDICAPLGLGDGVLMLIRNAHEKLDGTGYPDGLKYGQLPLPLRILCVADAFDAMSTRRPYRPVIDSRFRREQLNRFAGTQFDPTIVETLKGLISAGALDELYADHWTTEESPAAPPMFAADAPEPRLTMLQAA